MPAPVFRRRHAERVAEGRRQLALALIAHGACDRGHALVRAAQQRGGALHAVRADVRGQRRAVGGLERSLERRRVHQEPARQRVDGDALVEVLHQIGVHGLHGGGPLRGLLRAVLQKPVQAQQRLQRPQPAIGRAQRLRQIEERHQRRQRRASRGEHGRRPAAKPRRQRGGGDMRAVQQRRRLRRKRWAVKAQRQPLAHAVRQRQRARAIRLPAYGDRPRVERRQAAVRRAAEAPAAAAGGDERRPPRPGQEDRAAQHGPVGERDAGQQRMELQLAPPVRLQRGRRFVRPGRDAAQREPRRQAGEPLQQRVPLRRRRHGRFPASASGQAISIARSMARCSRRASSVSAAR